MFVRTFLVASLYLSFPLIETPAALVVIVVIRYRSIYAINSQGNQCSFPATYIVFHDPIWK